MDSWNSLMFLKIAYCILELKHLHLLTTYFKNVSQSTLGIRTENNIYLTLQSQYSYTKLQFTRHVRIIMCQALGLRGEQTERPHLHETRSKSQCHCLPAVWSWASSFPSLRLSVLIGKMEIITVSTSEGCEELHLYEMMPVKLGA